jgi:hypothetical protein
MTAPSDAAGMASAGLHLAVEFAEWEVAVVPAGSMWGAFWQSGDGRHRHYIVAPSALQLLAALRARVADSPSGETAPPAVATP